MKRARLQDRKKLSKKALSEIIGYVILITIALDMGGILYAWLKTYVPKEPLECDDGVSIFVKEYSCDTQLLTLTLKNNGRFSIDGYYIKASTSAEAEIAPIDLGSRVNQTGVIKSGNIVIFSGDFNPGGEIQNKFDITDKGDIKFIEIIPVQQIDYEGKRRIANCNNAKIKYTLSCPSA